MLREEPRDTIYQVPLVDTKVLRGVLPDCSYQPSYTIKDFPLIRYQGLQFVHMSYVYPNDYTRLTHMESENTCFYPENPLYMKMFGFSRYMRLDRPDSLGKGKIHREFGDHRRKIVLDEEDEFDKEAYEREKEARPDQIDNALFPDYGDDYDDYVQRRRRKLFSLVKQETNNRLNSSDTSLHIDQLKEGQWKDSDPLYQLESKKPTEPQESVQRVTVKLVETSGQQKNLTEFKQNGTFNKVEQIKPKRKKSAKKRKLKLVETTLKQLSPQSIPEVRGQFNAKGEPIGLSEQPTSKPHRKPRSYRTKPKQTFQELSDSNLQPLERGSPLSEKPQVVEKRKSATSQMEIQQLHTTLYKDTYPKFNERDSDSRKRLRDKEMEINMPLQDDLEKDINRTKTINRVKVNSNWSDTQGEDDEAYNRADNRRATREGERDTLWGPEEDFEGVTDEDLTPAPVFDTEVNWSQTFQVSHLDLQSQRSDWIDLSCNISGNLLLHSSDALSMVKAFMDQLNEKHHGRFKLMRVVNVIKRVDGIQGSRYFLELELKDANGQLLRLSQYRSTPELLLCNPVGFRWNPLATVHFIVPVKNQARWVLQLIADMEKLFRVTGDTNFNLIITDYNSTDMDVRKVLQKSSLPRYEYIKLGGNFERSAGLQAGVNLINDNHSIVFLCDLHIHFPPSIIDTIRKHCVEGYMAFAPIVMRLNCGATPLDARGFWEVNGFGLLGIYKSDLDAVGGMNTKEFTDRWGGEDWELLDRILQAGLEVERIHLRNFFHHYHSKRGMWNRRMSPSHG
ncbi:hypothetical protein Q5P01_012410 [Channa striata]|uniref:Hexosyltransferase n=1 Tax=Channa striata TaxID=64152 RepID=A0AA88MPR1_CHASR|nr:hypothetical protein Q5P01_012410 [Channa striata]